MQNQEGVKENNPLEDRVRCVERIIDELEFTYGPFSRGSDMFEKENDPNSDLLVTCDFGGAIIKIRAPLLGDETVIDEKHSRKLRRNNDTGRWF